MKLFIWLTERNAEHCSNTWFTCSFTPLVRIVSALCGPNFKMKSYTTVGETEVLRRTALHKFILSRAIEALNTTFWVVQKVTNNDSRLRNEHNPSPLKLNRNMACEWQQSFIRLLALVHHLLLGAFNLQNHEQDLSQTQVRNKLPWINMIIPTKQLDFAQWIFKDSLAPSDSCEFDREEACSWKFKGKGTTLFALPGMKRTKSEIRITV